MELPAGLAAAVQDVRPLQDQFAADAERVADLVVEDQAAARALWAHVEAEHAELVREQAVVTQAMSDEADDRRRAAADGEQAVQWRLGLSAVAALLGLLGLTWLLHRMGARLTDLLARERGVAEKLQHSLLPDRLPDLPGVRFAARYCAGGVGAQVGGDWYDVLALPGGRVGLVMGDVVGHDLQAASEMGQLRNALRACAAEGADPEEVLQRLNRLCMGRDLGELATVLYAVLDPVTGTVRIASAGHYPPLLASGGTARYLEGPPCPPVGAVREARYTSSEHALPAGSRLLLYTDGLVERRTSSVDEGLGRLRDLVAGPLEEDIEGLCDQVLTGMLAGVAPDDDVALLVVSPQAVLGPHLDLVWPAQAGRLAVLRHLLRRWLSEVGATDDEAYDILVACSEAATNAVEHAYGPGAADFRVTCDDRDGEVTVVVRDWGRWREPRGRDRGRGLGLMEGLMDRTQVAHGDSGTEVPMVRRLAVASERTRPRPLVEIR